MIKIMRLNKLLSIGSVFNVQTHVKSCCTLSKDFSGQANQFNFGKAPTQSIGKINGERQKTTVELKQLQSHPIGSKALADIIAKFINNKSLVGTVKKQCGV